MSQAASLSLHRRQRRVRVLLAPLLACLLLGAAGPAPADLKLIEADSTYVLGDNDSKVDARRIATQEAKRKALEQAGTFVASLTQVKDYRLTKDEVTAYTAGVVETDIIADETRGTLQNPSIYVKVRCRVDTNAMIAQIDRYRENQELREQLEASAREMAALQKERDDLVRTLAAEKDKPTAEATRTKLDRVLTHEETISTTRRVWSRLSPKMDFYDNQSARGNLSPAELEEASTALEQAVAKNPENQQAHLLLASVYEHRQDRVKAEQQLRAALERDEGNPLLHLRLGIILREEGRYQEALKEFKVIEQKRPQQPNMLFQTGLTHRAAGNCRLASGYMKRFLLYTRRLDRPDINRLKPKARETIEKCGDVPPPKKARGMP